MMGVAFEESFIAAKCEKAKHTPAFQNTFRVQYLSQWVGGHSAFVDMATWLDNDHTTPLPAPNKRTAFGGLDLSSTTDLSAFSIETRNGDKVEIHLKLYTPEEGLVERERRDRMPYREWARRGWLTICSGATIDQEVIKADIYQAKDEWDLVDIGYDRWNASKLVRELQEDGVVLVEMGQGYASLSAPTKSFLQLTVEKKFMTGGNGALTAMLDNTSALSDPSGNIKPDKSKSSSRIDGVIATIMGLDGLNRRGAPSKTSAYEQPFEGEVEDEVEEEEGQEEAILELPSVSPVRGRRSAYEE